MTQMLPRYTPNRFSLTTKKEIEAWLIKYNIQNYTINSDLTVDVDASVWLEEAKIHLLPFEFGIVTGDFRIWGNELTSLNGSPHSVGGIFYCSHNRLASLQGGPIIVGDEFDCSYNQIQSLEFSPLKSARFNCRDNAIKTLIGFSGAGQDYPGDFDVGENLLTCLIGAPSKIGGNFYCDHNKLVSLEGAPRIIEQEFSCSDNLLTSLMHCPEKISKSFDFSDNNITCLDYFPQSVGMRIMCENTGPLVEKITKRANPFFTPFKTNLDIYKIEQEKLLLEKQVSLGINTKQKNKDKHTSIKI